MGLFQHLLREAKGGIIGWSIGLGVLILLIAASYPAVRGQTDLDDLLAEYADSLGGLLGDCTTLTDYACYMDTQILAFLPVMLGIFGVAHAARILAGAEESGRLDILLSTPVSRRRLVANHLLVLVTAQAIVAAVVGVLMMLAALALGETDQVAASVLVGLNALPASLVATMLAYLLAAFVHRRSIALAGGTAFVLGSYFIGGLAPLSETLEPMKWLSVTHYYQQSQPMRAGLDLAYYVIMLPLAGLLGVLAMWRFEGKDITG